MTRKQVSPSKFPTKTKSKAEKQKTIDRAPVSPGESPSQYRARVDAPTTPSEPTVTKRDVKKKPEPFVSAGLVEAFVAQPGQPPRSIIDTPTGFGAVQSRFAPQAGLTAAAITEKGDIATVEAQQKGFQATRDFQLSGISQQIFERSQDIAGEFRKAAPAIEVGARGTPGEPLARYTGEFLAGTTEMLGMVPGGIETMARRPEVIVPAVETAVLTTPSGMAQQAKEDPGQFLYDVAAFAALGYGAGEIGAGLKAKAPKVVPKTTPQEFLVRTELPTAPKAKAEPPTFTQLEYIEQVTGKGKIFTEVKDPSIIPKQKPEPTLDVLIGKQTQPGFQEVFFKASPEEAAKLAKAYEGTIRQVRVDDVSAIEFTPTGLRQPPKPKSGAIEQRIGTLEPELIGDIGLKPSKKFELPFRFEKRVQAEPGKITLTPAERMVRDADVFETFGKVEAEPLQLTTRATKTKFADFMGEESAQLLKQRQRVQQDIFASRYEPPIKKEVPLRKFEIEPITARKPITFKEPTTKTPFKSQFEEILKRSEAFDILAAKTPKTQRMGMPVFGIGIAPQLATAKARQPDTSIRSITGISLSVDPFQSIIPDTDAITKAEAKAQPPKAVDIFGDISPFRPSKTAPTLSIFAPPEQIPKKKKKTKRNGKKPTTVKEAKFFELVSPIKEAKDLFGF